MHFHLQELLMASHNCAPQIVNNNLASTADELSGGTNIVDVQRPWTPKL